MNGKGQHVRQLQRLSLRQARVAGPHRPQEVAMASITSRPFRSRTATHCTEPSISVPLSLDKKKTSGGLTFASCKMPTQPLSHSSSSTRQEGKIRCKTSWVEIRTGKSLIVRGKTDSTWRKIISCIAN